MEVDLSRIVWEPAGSWSEAATFEEVQVLKSREKRLVLALRDRGGRELVAKRYRSRGVLRNSRYTLGRGRGRLEWKLLVSAREAGIPVPGPVAFGVGTRAGIVEEEWILMEQIPHAEDLATLARRTDMGRTLPLSKRSRSIEDLGRLVRQCHDAGLIHEDLHAGNILVNDDGLTLIDLDGASLRETLSRREREEALGIVGRFFHQRVSRTDRLRFLRAYLDDPGEVRKWAHNVEETTRRGLIRFWKNRIPRYTRENRYIGRLVRGRLSGWVDREYEDWGFLDRLDRIDEWMDEGEVFKDSRSAYVVRTTDPVKGEPIFVKRVESRFSKMIASLFRPTKAIRAWRGAHMLRMRDIPTPAPLAVLEERIGPFLGRQYLITREVTPTVALDRVDDPAALAFPLGRQLRILTERGLEHGDLKPANILIHDPEGKRPEVVLIDLESVRPSRNPHRTLARLARSMAADPRVRRTDLLRFLRAYLGPHPPGKERWKGLWREIEEWIRSS